MSGRGVFGRPPSAVTNGSVEFARQELLYALSRVIVDSSCSQFIYGTVTVTAAFAVPMY